MKLIECVPNFSEGSRPAVIENIRNAIAAIDGVAVLDQSSDPWHNRAVVTFVAPPDTIVDGAFAGIRAALESIDLRAHRGVHPRMGAADVVPFVPLEDTTMEECIALARTLGERVGRELDIPVFLYEHAATRPERRSLADVRRGGFEQLSDAMGHDPALLPDFGPPRMHPTFGAVAIGARPPLVAYNVFLGPEHNLEVAKRVARAVRESSGGRPGIRALAFPVNGQAQVSMNLVDLERTSLADAWSAVSEAAAGEGIEPTWSEIVGLVPERALIAAAVQHLRLREFSPDQVLERRVRDALAPTSAHRAPTRSSASDREHSSPVPQGGESRRDAASLDALAAATPAPGGGSAAAHVGAVAAALASMVAGITAARPAPAERTDAMREAAGRAKALMAELSELSRRDADAYADVNAAFRLPRSPRGAGRRRAIDAALLKAAEIPLETARACATAAELAAQLAEVGHRAASADAAVGALLAEAACRGAALDVRVNIHALSEPEPYLALVAEAERVVERAAAARERALRAAEP